MSNPIWRRPPSQATQKARYRIRTYSRWEKSTSKKKSFKEFQHGKVQALVATDVAARGIHVDGVALVVHYDPPEDHKAYIHRSGRTARAGSQGVVLSIIQPEQQKTAKKLQKRLGINESIRKINPDELPDIQPQLKEERQEKARHEHKRANDSRTPSKSKGKNRRTGTVKGLRRNVHRIKTQITKDKCSSTKA